MTAGPIPTASPPLGGDRPTTGSPQLADISRVGKLFGKVVAPATLLTALLFYFGWSFAYWFFDYLGVNSTLLGLTTQEYLMRSVDGLFFPLMVIAVLCLAVMWGRAVLPDRLAPAWRVRLSHVSVRGSAVVGLLLLVNGITGVLPRTHTVLNSALVVAPLSLVLGVLLLSHAAHAHRRSWGRVGKRGDGNDWRPLAEWTATFLLVGLGLFWAANDYSAALGATRARELVSELAQAPSTRVFSDKSLSLHATGVVEVRCSDPEAAYHFRYDGLVLVLQSGDQYLLLPRAWTPSTGVAIVVPRSDAVRLEFVPATAQSTGSSAGC